MGCHTVGMGEEALPPPLTYHPTPSPIMAKLTKQQLLADQARLDAHWAKHAKRTDHQAEARRLNRQDKAIDRGLTAWW